MEKDPALTTPDESMQLVSDIRGAIASLEPDVEQRNLYMNRRDWYIYGDGLWENLEIEDGFDRTLYNFLPRVVDIHTSQLMGRAFQIYSYYEKDDVSIYEKGDPQLEAALITNKRKKADADSRKRFVDAIIRDNGGYELFKHGARIGTAYGTTVYKMWWDNQDKKIRISLLESPQNYRAGWSDTNFRERDFDAYVYQISYSDAKRQYGSYLGPDEDFDSSGSQDSIQNSSFGLTSDPLDQNMATPRINSQTYRQMVQVIDFTGYLDGWAAKDGKLVEVDKGDETRISLLIVGGHVCHVITDENRMPKYYVINNRSTPRRAWGDSDLPDSALEINATYIERMSDYITLVNKTLFPMIMARGFEMSSVPKKRQRQMSVVPMAQEQSLEAVNLPQQFGFEYSKLLDELKEAFVKVTGVGRVLFDDPTVNNDSNQALMTTLKGVIDIVEDKQTRWEQALIAMFTDALALAAKYVPAIKEAMPDDEYWYLYVRWPSVLRREDAAYQTMYLNRFNAGTISMDSYLEAMGTDDVSEELDRIKDNMQDPVTAAIMGHALPELAHYAVLKEQGIPAWGYVTPKVTLRGDLTPQQEANMAENYQWNSGPYGPSIGPQGQQGTAANDNVINQGFIQGNAFEGGMPTGVKPGQPINPQLTPDQNVNAPVSQPGSGAPAVSPQGAVNMNNQNNGK